VVLYIVNIPYNCTDKELKEWIESRGIPTRSIQIIRDLVAGVSPAFAYVELEDNCRTLEAIAVLNGKKLRANVLQVKHGHSRAASAPGGLRYG
jgi:RNA recognition motif-containing protein